jgi:hypothetical protein
LKKVPINDKTKSFNILTSAIATKQEYIQKGQFYIPLPLDPQVRKISIQDGANYCYEAIQELKNGGVYQKKMEELLTLYNKDENRLIADILAFFRSETSEEYTQFIQPL